MFSNFDQTEADCKIVCLSILQFQPYRLFTAHVSMKWGKGEFWRRKGFRPNFPLLMPCNFAQWLSQSSTSDFWENVSHGCILHQPAPHVVHHLKVESSNKSKISRAISSQEFPQHAQARIQLLSLRCNICKGVGCFHFYEILYWCS